MKTTFFSTILSAALFLGATVQAAEPPASRTINSGAAGSGSNSTNGTSGTTGTTSANCNIGQSRAELDINNVRTRYLNAGDMFWDPQLSLPKYEVPKRSDNLTASKNSIFAAAIWLGGVERGTNNILVMVQTYRGQLRNYWPGPIQYTNQTLDLPTSSAVCSAWDQHFKCNRRTVREFVDAFEANGSVDCDQIPNEIKFWPGKGNPYLKQRSEFAASASAVASVDNNLANFFDRDSNGVYNPCRGDYPLWAGTEADFNCPNARISIDAGADQVLWWVCNDAGNKKNFEENTTTVPEIGMEVHYEAFAYASTDATNDMTFLRQKLYNKGSFILDKTYLAQWVDPDLGNPGDDYVGCDVMRGLGICYNGDEIDEGQTGYGENPPAVGVDFFRGPFPDDKFDNIDWDLDCLGPQGTSLSPPDTTERITMSGFVYYNIGGNVRNGDPRKFTDFYNYLQNKWKDGTDITWGGAGLAPLSLPDHPKADYMFPNVTADSDPYGFACGATGCTSPLTCPGAWNEKQAGNAAGDRRFLANNGPFTLEPGDFNECTIGIVWARATSGGPTGSFGKLLAADDLAQERFDRCFKRSVGPNSPNLEVIEGDRSLVFSIIPDVIVKAPLMTTETYTELNLGVSIGDPNDPQDLFYRFQGYKIYQLVDDKVSVQDLNNPDKARLLEGDFDGDGNSDFEGIMDVKDGVTEIRNLLYNPELDAFVETPMVRNSPDNGIFHTFRVTRDMFNPTGQLSNFKKYYYAVVAYGYIRNKQEVREKYLQGVNNFHVYTAIPHKLDPESFGSVASYEFGGGLPITRVSGEGTGGNVLELGDGEEAKIIQNNRLQQLTYAPGSGPVNIKIYNPKAIKGGDFEVRFSSYLKFRPTSSYTFNVGDTLVADAVRPLVAPYNVLRAREPFVPGRAVIRRIISASGGVVEADIDLLCEGGTFVYNMDDVEKERDEPSAPRVLKATRKEGLSFSIKGDAGKTGKAEDFVAYDFWTLTEKTTGLKVEASQPVSRVIEQLIPEFGISIRANNAPTPGTDIDNPLSNNGVLPSSVILNPDPLKTWIYPVSGDAYPWYRDDVFAVGTDYYSLDPKGSYRNFAGGGWFPYVLTSRATISGTSPGPILGGPQVGAFNDDGASASQQFQVDREISTQAMSRLRNVDVVFTSDKSKWTRCAVIQCDSFPGSSSVRPKWTMAKSRVPSVNIDFKPDGSVSPFNPQLPSRGMSWFPGYAIDLDRGVRLNMMFSESILLDTSNGFRNPYRGKGNDLQWEPRANLGGLEGTRNFIFVMTSEYDQGAQVERDLDKFFTQDVNSQVGSVFLPNYRTWNLENIMYAGLMARNIDFINVGEQPMNLNDVRVKLRVNRAYKPFSFSGGTCAPTYQFKIDNNPVRNQTAVGKSALDLIRITPNPYISVSPYETGQIDNRVKIVNLPTQCVVSIFNLSGSLIRQYNFDQSSSRPYASIRGGEEVRNERGSNFQTWLDWDLKNQAGIPIASGVYIIHIKSDKLGEKVIKWFGVLRPIDLDTFN